MAPYHHGDLRSAMLASAERILEQDGIGALTMRAAAREAGVSHAAPAHHFGDLSGLLTELAAAGFRRLADRLKVQASMPARTPAARLVASGRGYVGFAQAHPGLFQLMFRSERLDWRAPSLADAGASAFAYLSLADDPARAPAHPPGLGDIVAATARWSFVHGMAILLIDGRLGATTDLVPGVSTDALVEGLLECLGRL